MINGYDIEPRWGSFNLNGTIALLHSRGEDQLKKDFTQSMWGIIYTVHVRVDSHCRTSSGLIAIIQDGKVHH